MVALARQCIANLFPQNFLPTLKAVSHWLRNRDLSFHYCFLVIWRKGRDQKVFRKPSIKADIINDEENFRVSESYTSRHDRKRSLKITLKPLVGNRGHDLKNLVQRSAKWATKHVTASTWKCMCRFKSFLRRPFRN